MITEQERLEHTAMITRARQLRRRMSPIENRVWSFLRNGHVDGMKFRRQHPLGPYIADFYCHAYQLVIEIDGPSHVGQENYDQERTHWLNANGYRVIRFSNIDVLKNPNGVHEVIRAACRDGHALTRSADAERPLPEGEVNTTTFHANSLCQNSAQAEHALTRITDVIRPLPEGEVNNAILSQAIEENV